MKRKSDKEIKDELRAIYAGHDGEIPDMTKLEPVKSSRVTRFLIRSIFFLLMISAIAWGGFFVWSRGGISPNRPLEISSDTPAEVRAGDENFYVFRYKNEGNAPIASLQMKLTLPSDFTLLSSDPEPTDGLTWTLGTLSKGSDGEVKISGVFRSEVPSIETLQALFTYKPANFSSDFQDIETAKVSVGDSVLELTLTGPEKALPGDEVTYVMNVQNTGTRNANGVLVSAIIPNEFVVTNTSIPPTETGTTSWTFDTMAAAEIKAIELKGRYTASVSGEQTVSVKTAFLDEEKTELLQSTAETKTDVLGGALAFHLVANGSSTDQHISPGKTLRLSIDYANSGSETIHGLVLSLSLTGDTNSLPINWEEADLAGGVREGNIIVWDTSVIEEFKSFSPSSSGVLDLSLPILTSLTAGTTANLIDLALSAVLAKVGSIESPHLIESSPIRVQINTDLRSSAHARYYSEDGEPLGTGPLPPTVGETTTYRIVWRVANSFHALKNIRMTTNLPPKVAWTGNTDVGIGKISFNETTRMVTWEIDSLPLSIPGSEATFDVAITPEESDESSFFKLTNAIAVEATDMVTGNQVTNAKDILTTELPEDTEANGKGVVSEAE